MATNISDEDGPERYRWAMERAKELTKTGRKLAEVLWSIERYGDNSHGANPPPLHTDLAWQLQTSKENTDALYAALQALIKEQSDG